MDYHYGNKKQWRRWVWNRLAERIGRNRDGLVLFLAGENAHDVEEAQRRGFKPRNMLAVEQDGDTLRKLRADGLLTIQGDLCEVLLNWPRSRTVSVVLADFCCGLEKRLLQSFLALDIHPAFADTAFAVNMLRGRDSSTNMLRGSGSGFVGIEDKHRGAQLYFSLAAHWASGGISDDAPESVIEETVQRRLPLLQEVTSPAFHSYRSTAGSQVFDCVVYRSPFGEFARRSEEVASVLDRSRRVRPGTAGYEQRRRTAAVLAHHTRRLVEAGA